jgi:transcriptional regulator with XRE-family HTH domain
MHWGERLKEVMRRKHVGIKLLAANLGVEVRTIDRYRARTSPPSADKYRAIAAGLGLTVEQLDLEFAPQAPAAASAAAHMIADPKKEKASMTDISEIVAAVTKLPRKDQRALYALIGSYIGAETTNDAAPVPARTRGRAG